VYKFGISLQKMVLGLSAVGLAWNIVWPGGWITGLFIEYWVHFSLGAAVYFFLCELSSNKERSAVGGMVAGLGLLSVALILYRGGDFTEVGERAYLELALLAMFAFALILIRPFSVRISESLLWKPMAMLGAISYSLYLVHQFNLTFVNMIARLLLPQSSPLSIVVILKVLLHVAIATGFWVVCERPFLNKRSFVVSVSKAAPSDYIPTSGPASRR
jgi:peptidoglycan/LPS O-acetylase OafA/YrhL